MLVDHPGLLDTPCARMLAELELRPCRSRRLRQASSTARRTACADAPRLRRARSSAAGLGGAASPAGAGRAADRWCLGSARPMPPKMSESFRPGVTLHRRALTLHRELKTARAGAWRRMPSEAIWRGCAISRRSLPRSRVRRRLIEGFGQGPGRAARFCATLRAWEMAAAAGVRNAADCRADDMGSSRG